MFLEPLEDRTVPSLNFGWAFGLGSTSVNDSGYGITTDTGGNVYLSGSFFGTVDFDPGPGTMNLTSAGLTDAFAAKYSPTGTLVWATRLGGPDGDNVTKVALDGSNNPHIVFHTFAGASTSVSVVKLNADDGNVLWTTIVNSGFVGDIAVAPSGQVYVTGGFNSHTFVTQLDAAGSVLWCRATSGTAGDYGSGLAADSSGNVYVTGNYSGTVDFNPGPATFELISTPPGSPNAVQDVFVWKLDSAGAFVWAGSMGSNAQEQITDIAVDGAGNAYLTGGWGGAPADSKKNDFDPGPGVFRLTNNGARDVFVVKLAPDPTDGGRSLKLSWAKSMGGRDTDNAGGVAADGAGNVYTTGQFQSTADFDPGSGRFNLTSAGSFDIFVSKLTSTGDFAAAARLGGGGYDFGGAIAVDTSANVYTTGRFQEYGAAADFDPGPGTFNLTAHGTFDSDIFVSKLTQTSPLLAAGGAAPAASPTEPLTLQEAELFLGEAIARWQAAGVDTASLTRIEVRIADLGATTLGLASGNTIWLDDNAAGWGWFVDPTPWDDSEFTTPGNQGEQGKMELLTALAHEIGHLLGQEHAVDGVMIDTLATGIRRMPGSTEVNDWSAILDVLVSEPLSKRKR